MLRAANPSQNLSEDSKFCFECSVWSLIVMQTASHKSGEIQNL